MREVEAESSTWIGIPCKSNSGKGDSNNDGRSSVRRSPGYIERMYVFMARSCRLVLATSYHIDAARSTCAIESTLSCFCNFLCCCIAKTKPPALSYIQSVPMASGKHIFMSMRVLLTSQAFSSSILPFLLIFVKFFRQISNYSPALPENSCGGTIAGLRIRLVRDGKA